MIGREQMKYFNDVIEHISNFNSIILKKPISFRILKQQTGLYIYI